MSACGIPLQKVRDTAKIMPTPNNYIWPF